MTSRNRYRTHSAWKAAKYAGRMVEKSAVGLARWATTDHTGTAKLLSISPSFGFIDTLSMILVTLVTSHRAQSSFC
jgi:putative effector of murein hydrolase